MSCETSKFRVKLPRTGENCTVWTAMIVLKAELKSMSSPPAQVDLVSRCCKVKCMQSQHSSGHYFSQLHYSLLWPEVCKSNFFPHITPVSPSPNRLTSRRVIEARLNSVTHIRGWSQEKTNRIISHHRFIAQRRRVFYCCWFFFLYKPLMSCTAASRGHLLVLCSEAETCFESVSSH